MRARSSESLRLSRLALSLTTPDNSRVNTPRDAGVDRVLPEGRMQAIEASINQREQSLFAFTYFFTCTSSWKPANTVQANCPKNWLYHKEALPLLSKKNLYNTSVVTTCTHPERMKLSLPKHCCLPSCTDRPSSQTNTEYTSVALNLTSLSLTSMHS